MTSDDYSPFNNEPRIRLVNKNDCLIKMVNQLEATRLLKYQVCELLMIKPLTIRFPGEIWSNYQKPNNKLSLSSNLYGNYHVQGPDGHEMFRCDVKKALWYLNHDLAEFVDQHTIRFKFQPGGAGEVDPYYLHEKKNQCVVCGGTKDLTRHHVVPVAFKKFLPNSIKHHNWHDILLLCVDCHRVYETEAGKLKQEICKKYGIDIAESGGGIYLPEIGKVIKAAKALKYKSTIPEARKIFLQEVLKNYLNKQEITESDIDRVITFYPWKSTGNKHYGQAVIEKVDDLQEFVEWWRVHFVNIMNPRFLPTDWDTRKPLVYGPDRRNCTKNSHVSPN